MSTSRLQWQQAKFHELLFSQGKAPALLFVGTGSSGGSPCTQLFYDALGQTRFQRPAADSLGIESERCINCRARDVAVVVTAYGPESHASRNRSVVHRLFRPPVCSSCCPGALYDVMQGL